MKRSGSKLIAKAGSMRNMGKQGYKFTVKLHCESVDKVLSANDVVLSWERNDKIRATKSVRVDRDSRAADFRGEILTQDITFFKRKKDGSNFEDKVFRLVLRHDDASKKAIGKIDLNFSQYIDIPSSSKRLAADLSNGSKLIIRVESKFLREVTKKTRKQQDDTSSVGSAFENESEFDPTDYNEMTANLDDLDVGDDPPLSNPTSSVSQPSSFSSINSNTHHDPPSSQSNSQQQQHQQQTQLSAAPVLSSLSSASNPTSMTSATPTRRPPLAPSNSNVDDPLGAPAPQTTVPAHRRPSGPSASPGGRDIAGRGRRSRDTSPNRDAVQPGGKALVSGGNGRFRRSGSRQDSLDHAAPSISKQEFDALQKENRQLRRRNDDLQMRVAELEHRLESYASMAGGNSGPGLLSADSMTRAEIDDLMQENKSLKEHVEDLEMRIRREPIYADVVRDLREAKMALAIMNIERDELKQEIRKLKK